jgi:Mrp family chromosome partitioning ATPase
LNGAPHAENGNWAEAQARPTSGAVSRDRAALDDPESSGKPADQGSARAASTLHAETGIVFDPNARLILDSAVVEHYGRLRTKILQQHAVKMVLNSFAMLPNSRVLVIDSDLRRGSIGKWLGVHNNPRLSHLLEGAAKLEDEVIKCANFSMQVVTRGYSQVSPTELLHSPKLNAAFRRMTEHFDLVLVDS